MSTATDELLTCATDALNALLRSEMTAVETYTRAIKRFDDPMVIGELQKVRDEHRRAERALRDRVIMLNGIPAEDSGVWDAFAAVSTFDSHPLGCATLIAALRQGEEHAGAAYEEALNHEDVHPDCHRLIGGDLLPACHRHVDELNRLLGGTC